MTNNRSISERLTSRLFDLNPTNRLALTNKIEKALNEAELCGFEKAKEIGEKIAIDLAQDHDFYDGAYEVGKKIANKIKSLQPNLEGGK